MGKTAWHITISTIAARLHGDDRPTVDRDHNRFGTPFLKPDPIRNTREREAMSVGSVVLSSEQRQCIEDAMPEVCLRGGWDFVTCAAGPDHVHVLVRIDESIHGKQVRAWMKRWLTRVLDERWFAPSRSDGSRWWCEGGSTKAVRDAEYFEHVVRYINGQRTPRSGHGLCASHERGEDAPARCSMDSGGGACAR
ncbi:MAG: transposase [Phycisphaerales bacterium]|nr:transposase [Phycisphaerales bacterium]